MSITASILILTLIALQPAGDPAAGQASEQTTLIFPPWSHNLGFNQFRQFHLTVYGGRGHTIDDPRGIAAVKLAANDDPGTGDDDELTVFGVNAGAHELIYNRSLFELGFAGAEEGIHLVDPVGVAADGEGLVAVADRGADRVVLLRVTSANDLQPVGSIGGEEVRLARPAGVALEAGCLYIADSGNNRVVVTDTTGALLRIYGVGQGVPAHPFGVAVIADPEWNRYRATLLAVTSGDGQWVSSIPLAGGTATTVPYSQVSGGKGGFGYAAFDYYANLYLTDSTTGCIYKFDQNMKYLTRIDCSDAESGRLDAPRGIAIYRRFGQVFVAEETGASYLWVGTDVEALSCRAAPEGGDVRLAVRFVLTEQSDVTVRLEAPACGLSETLAEAVFTLPGPVERSYVLGHGAGFADCEYFVTVEAKPTYASVKNLRVDKKARVRWEVGHPPNGAKER